MLQRTGKAIPVARRALTRRLAWAFLLFLPLGGALSAASPQTVPDAEPGAGPILTGLSPQSALQGTMGLDVTLTGQGFIADPSDPSYPSTVGFNPPTGITIKKTTVKSDTEIVVTIDVDQGAPAGIRDVTVTNDGTGGGTSNALRFTVNRAPRVVMAIPNQVLGIGDPPLEITLSKVFVDDDGHPMAFSAASDDPVVALAGISGGAVLTVVPLATGTTTIRVSAQDSLGAQAQTDFEVTVNSPPVVENPIPDQQLNVGDAPFETDLAMVFADADGDPLTFSAASDSGSVATAGISGASTLTVTPRAVGAATITLRANDGRGGQAQTTFKVTVGMVNTPPSVASAIPDQQLNVGDAPFETDLAMVFADADGDPLTFSAASDSGSVATAGISGASTLTVTPRAVGAATITLRANDGRGGQAQTTFRVTVVAVNSPPTVHALPDQRFKIGDPPFTKNLNEVFTDPDDDALTFRVEADSVHVVVAGISGDATLTVVPLAAGTARVTIRANDGRGGQAQTTFKVTVNTPPTVVRPIANQSLGLGKVFEKNVKEVFTDADGDGLTFSAASDNGIVAAAGISGDSLLTVIALATGTATITVTANDGRGGQTQTAFVVAVGTANSLPEVANPIPNQSLDLGGHPRLLDLTTVFADADGDRLTFSAASDSGSVATASISGTSTLTISPLGLGTATITVTADDGRGGRATTSFKVTVGVNTAPTATGTFANQQLEAGGPPFQMDLNEIFSDSDGDALAFNATSSDAGVATAGISGPSMLTVAAVGLGTATITVTADDRRGGQAQAHFAVNVSVAFETDVFTLRPNYPNPFNPSTLIEYTVPATAEAVVRLDVYTVVGRLVRVLVSGPRAAGLHRVTWDGTDDAGVLVASGVYLYRLQAEGFSQTRRMLLVK